MKYDMDAYDHYFITRKGTSMWDYFSREGIIFNNIQEIKDSSLSELIAEDEEVITQNIKIFDKLLNRHKDRWEVVFKDI